MKKNSMEFDLCTIDWTAIGSIATTIALIFAFWSLHTSSDQNKKNRELEIKLRQQVNEQNRLDEYVKTVLKMMSLINFKDIINYSYKLCNDSNASEAIQYFENLSFQFEMLLQELYLNTHKIKVNANTTSINNRLEIISLNLQNLAFYFKMSQNKNIQDEIISSIKEEIKKLNEGELPDSCTVNIFDRADKDSYLKRLLLDYSTAVNAYLISSLSMIKENLKNFIKNEQERIDNLLIVDDSDKSK